MKRTTWFSMCGSLLGLAVAIAGCGGDFGASEEGETIGSAKLAFEVYAPNACSSGCTSGAPNGTCEVGETSFNCAVDCSCGDGQCDPSSETVTTCPLDCKYGTTARTVSCGDHRCDPWEYDQAGIYCAADCDIAPVQGTQCGDLVCGFGETSATCPADCGNAGSCGNGTCDAGETNATCEADCNNSMPAGRFYGAACNGYKLYASYTDGQNGTVSHPVTDLAGGCNLAFPWKVDAYSATCDGTTLVKPDGTLCTVTGAQCTTNINGIFTLGTPYAMAATSPSSCGSFTTAFGHVDPIEWVKIDTIQCGNGNPPCTVHQCDGTTMQKAMGSAVRWRPQVAPWSFFADKCQ